MVAALFFMVLGGGGTPAPLSEMLLQIVFSVLFVIWFAYSGRTPLPRAVWIGAALLISLPILQLIPLPPVLWHALGGREPLVNALALVGRDNEWWPLSLAPERTFASLLAMVPVAGMLVMAASLTNRGRMLFFGLVTAVAMTSFLVGVGQLTGVGNGVFRFYSPDTDYFLGFQANRNSQADIFLIANICSAAFVRYVLERKSENQEFASWLVAHATVALLFLLGAILTGSRMGMALIPISLMGQIGILWPWLMRLNIVTKRLLLVGALFALILGAGAVFASPVLYNRVARFSQTAELRPEIWKQTLQIISIHLPWGSGIGTFIPVYQAYEPLNIVGFAVINRAHCDYLEWFLETGWPGVLVLIAGSTLLLWQISSRIPGRSVNYCNILAACSVLLIVVIHSFVDYPLRSMSLGGLTLVMIAFLATPCLGYRTVAEPDE